MAETINRDEAILQAYERQWTRLADFLGTPHVPEAETPEKLVDLAIVSISQLRRERELMAMLAAETPQFNNPLVAWDAQALRDRILAARATRVSV